MITSYLCAYLRICTYADCAHTLKAGLRGCLAVHGDGGPDAFLRRSPGAGGPTNNTNDNDNNK